MSDRRAVSDFRGGLTSGEGTVNEQGLEVVFVRCEARLGRYLAQMVRDRALAEDLLQDTYLAALRAARESASVASPEAWLFGIARHRALEALRRRRRFRDAIARLSARPEVVEEGEGIAALRDLLERTLTPEDRSLVLLRYLHDFEAAELAEMTGMRPDAVRQRISRARRKLLAAASEQGGLVQ